MKTFLAVVFVVLLTFEEGLCGTKCSGTPPMYDGNKCASTTTDEYNDIGECKCYHANNDTRFGWVSNKLTVRASENVFDSNAILTCGENCGKCVKLTTTGGYEEGVGASHIAGESYYFMITDVCQDSVYCTDSPNDLGFEAHFEFNDENSQVTVDLEWTNPEVTYEIVECDDAPTSETPSSNDYDECNC